MKQRWHALALCGAMVAGFAGTAGATGPNFRPDVALDLRDSHAIGRVAWHEQGDEIVAEIGTHKHGVLLFGPEFENAGVYAQASCATCEVGLLIRVVPAANGGVTGILVSVAPGGPAMALVTIDGTGAFTSRGALGAGPGKSGLASPFGIIVSDAMRKAPPYKPLPLPDGVHLPDVEAASGAPLPGWNAIDVMAYGTALTATLNAGVNPALPPSTLPADPGFGRVGIYVAGHGTVHLRNVLVKDLDQRATPAAMTANGWQKRQLDPWTSSWGAAVGDLNHDGIPDIVAGPYWWEGPDFTRAHEIYTPVFYNPATDYPQKSFISFVQDFDGDGWPDVLTISGNSGYSDVTLYTNPRGQSRHWQARQVLSLIGGEETLLADIDGDGQPELIHAYDHALAYSKWNADASRWTTVKISEPGPWAEYVGHGIGIGDIDGDGRTDYVTAYGWWQQPASGAASAKWQYHPFAFGRRGLTQGGAGGAAIGVYDVNGDGLTDVVTTLEGHGFGLAWFEQQRDSHGTITWVRHMIMDGFLDHNAGDVTFTQPHGAAFADIDGDGIPDILTGKRLMSHLFSLKDPDPFGAAVLYVYRTVRDRSAPGGARFVPSLVDNASGVGSHPVVTDLDGDGRPDIVTTGALGTFVFYNKLPKP